MRWSLLDYGFFTSIWPDVSTSSGQTQTPKPAWSGAACPEIAQLPGSAQPNGSAGDATLRRGGKRRVPALVFWSTVEFIGAAAAGEASISAFNEMFDGDRVRPAYE